jgi:tetratricopeptide (TPR) repeat protein
MQYLRRLTAHNPDEIRNRGQLEQTDIRYDSARTALVDILDAVSAETCCLLQIEDAHWLDPQSIRMMEEIADWLGQHQILLLATSRSFSPASERISPIEVRPLPVDASRTVAHALAREGSLIDEAYFMWCISSSGGNPYYLIELLRKDPHEGNKYEAPASLTRLLHARVLMLSFEARRLLEVCCVLGIHSTIERIEKTIELSRSAILRALDELDTSGMIELEGSRVLSRHDLLSSVVLILMRGSVKVTLHRYVAIQLEAEADVTHSIGLIWESAEHWLSACDAPRAIQLLRRCGNHLIDVGMSEEAARVLERAAGLSSEPSEQYLIGTERARALMRADRSVEAVIVIDELLLIRPSIYPRPSPLDEVGVMSLQARWRNGGVLPSLVREGLDWLSSPNTIPKERISAARWLLAAADNLCDSALGQQVYDHVVLDLKSESISADERLMFEMIYNCCVGDARLSVDLANELVSYARRMNAPSLSMNYLRHAAHVHRCHAKIDDAIALAMEAVEIAGRLNASQALAIGAGFLSTLFMHVGDNRSADLWLKRAEQSNSRHDNAILVLNTLGCRAELAIRMEQEQVAESCVSQCGPAAERWQAARSYARTFALETHLAVLKGNSISERSLNSFVELFDVVKSTVFQDYSAEALVLGLKSAGRLEDARRVADGFVLEHRRDLSSLSTTLASVVSSLKLTVE